MPPSPTRPRPDFSQLRYRPLDHLVVRAPVLPVEAYHALASGNGTAPAGAGDARGRAAARERPSGPVAASDGTAGWELPQGSDGTLDAAAVWERPLVRQAISVASPSLAAALRRAGNGGGTDRLRESLLRYLIRMSTRPTPFGLFAGVGIARWADRTDLELAGPVRTRTRLDMEWLLDQVLRLEADPALRRHLRLVANTAAFERGGRIHLSERAPTAAALRPPLVDSPAGPAARRPLPGAPDGVAARATGARGPEVSVRATRAVRLALRLARRPIPYADLAAHLLADIPGATRQRVDALLGQLCDATLLLTDLRPPLTTTDPTGWVVARLTALPAASEHARRLAGLAAEVAALDQAGPVEAAAAYAGLGARVAAAGGPPARSLLQVDAAFELRGAGLNRAVGEAVAKAAELLVGMSPLPDGPPHLAAYRRAFQRRYGTDRTVPLLELLDPRFGLGPLGQPGVAADGTGRHSGPAADRREQLLLDLAGRALRDRRAVLELDGELAGQLATWAPDPSRAPASLELYVSVAARSAAALDAGDFTVVVGHAPGASPAGRNLGRFADLHEPTGRVALAETARVAAPPRPGVAVAELVYLPRRLRQANVAVRPSLHDHELLVATSPGVPPDKVIPLDELTVGVAEGRLRLWWPAGGVEVEVAAGHMLNPTEAPAVARFLSEVGRDGRAQLGGFSWGPAGGLPFLPRVQAGRVVLRPASWRRNPGDLADGFEAGLARWRAEWAVPRHVRAGRGDRQMLLDLDDPEQARQLRPGVAAGHPVVVHEALPGPDDAWLPGPGGRFLAELVVPLRLVVPTATARSGAGARTAATPESHLGPPDPASRAPRPAARGDRLRPPGSDWLYGKLYGPREGEDGLVAGPVRDLAETALGEGDAAAWHFLRYGDPEPHLRLRFRGEPRRLTGSLLPGLCEWAAELVDSGACDWFTLDTYEREVERYGGPEGVAAAEDLFAADSRCVAGLLALGGRGPSLDRIALAVLTADDLLAALGLGHGRRLALLGRRVADRRASGTEYRRRKAVLRPLLADPGRHLADPGRLLTDRGDLADPGSLLDDRGDSADPGGTAVLDLLAERRAALVPVAARLSELADAGGLGGRSLDELAASFLHLHCNRLLGPDPAAEQLVLGLLLRTRESLARAPLPDPAAQLP